MPQLRPPNWTRSKIRRRHLISLGIPVNLDEVNPYSGSGRAMPTLTITTRSSSTPPTHRPPSKGIQNGSAYPSRSGTPRPSTSLPTPTPTSSRRTPNTASSLGPKPELDREQITQLLTLDPGMLGFSYIRILPADERM